MLRNVFMALLLGMVIHQPLIAQEGGEKEPEEDQKEEERDTTSFKDNLFFGGYLWAQFGTFTQLEVAPQVGYHITGRLDAGIGGKYMYYHSNSQYWGKYTSHIYGGSAFTSYTLIKNLNKLLPLNLNGKLVGHLEYEALSMPNKVDVFTNRSGNRFWSHNYFVGGGLRQQIGERAFISFLILYNLNEKSFSPYENPMIRIGFGF